MTQRQERASQLPVLVGCFALGFSVACVLATLWASGSALRISRSTYDAGNLKAIGMGCWDYAQHNGGRFPPDLTPVALGGKVSIGAFVTHRNRAVTGSREKVMEWTDYVYLPGCSTASSPRQVLAFLPPGMGDRPNGAQVLFADGTIAWYAPTEFVRVMNHAQVEDRSK